jgi:chemosensory pili system protein ChpA (sensor histidine kinase/response regulator)
MDRKQHAIESVDDLSALAWVHDELRRSIETAHKALRRHVRESESLTQSDVDAVDPTILRSARSNLHQGVGALELVGLSAGAQMLRASERAVIKLTSRGNRLTAPVCDAIERSSFALMDYLARMLAGKPVSPVALFSQYQAVQKLAEADRVHPADLWPHDWRWRDVTPTDVPARVMDDSTRAIIEGATLALMRAPSKEASQELSRVFAGLANGVIGEGRDRRLATMWQLASGFFEAQSHGMLPHDLYTKRILSRVLAQWRMSEKASAGESVDVSDRLAQDLLFFCAQAGQPTGLRAQRLSAVRQAWGLTQATAIDYNAAQLGRFDPTWIAQARKRVGAAKDSWSAIAADEKHRLPSLMEQVQLVGESLNKLYPSGDALASALYEAANDTVRRDGIPTPSLAMEVATALLYLEASLEDADFDHPAQATRVNRLAERIHEVRAGGAQRTLDPWMEELYRRVADRQTMGSVVQELRTALSETEKAIDQYFRDTTKRELLMAVPGQLQVMRGVLSVLGLDQAALTVVRMRDDVEPLLTHAVDAQDSQSQGTFDRMAGNLGALGFLIDMLSVQPQMAKSLFRFDADSGLLQSVLRHADEAAELGVSDTKPVEPKLVEQVEALARTAAQADVPNETLVRDLERLTQEAMVSDQPALAATMSQVKSALRHAQGDEAKQAVRHDLAQAMADFVQSTSMASPLLQPELAPLPSASVQAKVTAPTAEGQTGLEGDDEMLAIFLEEAHEVVGTASQALVALQSASEDVGELTTLRRAFHTLKGSSRMVGLNDFGEAAWSCEQLYNARLADKPKADADLLGFSNDAVAYLGDWIAAIEARRDGGHQTQTVREAADAMRLSSLRAPLVLPMARADAPVSRHGVPLAPTSIRLDRDAFAQEDAANNPRLVGSKASHTAPFDAKTLEALGSPSERGAKLTAESMHPPPAVATPATADARVDAGKLDGLTTVTGGFGVAAAAAAAAAAPSVASVLGPLTLDVRAYEPPLTQSPPFAATQPAEASSFGPTQAVEPAPMAQERLAVPITVETISIDPVAVSTPVPLPVPEATVDASQDQVPDRAEPTVALAEVAPENVKTIGPLKVSLPLYTIYIHEADDQSRRLQTGLSEWAHDTNAPLGEELEALAHALAGNSSTVGHAELSHEARSLEHALARCRERARGHPAEAALFVEAADDMRRVLHQFAAGFLASPNAQVVARLEAHEHTVWAAPIATPTAAPIAPPVAAPVAAASLVAKPPARHARANAPSTPTRPAPLSMDDDEIDAVDAVDEELFSIFEEEGVELFPKLAQQMREWVAAPADAASGNACLRSLHTIKGGARLAGAMRLGERAHRLEASIEQLMARGDAAVDEVEALQMRVDALGNSFDRMRSSIVVLRDDDDDFELPPSEDDVRSALKPKGSQADKAGVADPVPVPLATPALTPTSVASKVSEAKQGPIVASGALDPTRLHVDWSRFARSQTPAVTRVSAAATTASGSVRVRAALLDKLVNHAGEVSITRSRIDADVAQLKGAIIDLTDNLDRMRNQLREIELQAESQISSRLEAVKVEGQQFDPLEMDRFTRFQELTRMLAESVNDVATVHRGLQRTVQSTEDQLAAQARLTRDLQDNLLRTRMVEFDSLSDRLYRVVRQAAKETGKQVRLDIINGTIEVDRGVLERMAGSFEHLLRNCVSHGIELPDARKEAGKEPFGTITITLHQEGNEVAIEVRDDGAGLNYERIRARAVAQKLIDAQADSRDSVLAPLIFAPGFTTATEVTELAGRGVGMDVVRSEVNALGGRVETTSVRGQGTAFKLIVPLTTAVTQVVMLRAGEMTVAISSTLVESVARIDAAQRDAAERTGELMHEGHHVAYHWLGALLQDSLRSRETATDNLPLIVVRSAQQRVAVHVDEVLGNQEVVVKNLGPQLSRLPGLAGITILPSGKVVLIYNPVALANLYGSAVREALAVHARGGSSAAAQALGAPPSGEAVAATSGAGAALAMRSATVEAVAPLVLVVDDSLTVRRVTQRLLQREGFRVTLAKDGQDGLDKLAEERPAIVLSDIEMPRMDGFDMVRGLREDARFSDLPVIMITSRIAQKHKDHAATLGVNHYLGKPYAEDELLQLIRQYTGSDTRAS